MVHLSDLLRYEIWPIFYWLIAIHRSPCLPLESIRSTTSYDATIPSERDFHVNTTIKELYVKIQNLFESGSSSYDKRLKKKALRKRISTILMKRASLWV